MEFNFSEINTTIVETVLDCTQIYIPEIVNRFGALSLVCLYYMFLYTLTFKDKSKTDLILSSVIMLGFIVYILFTLYDLRGLISD